MAELVDKGESFTCAHCGETFTAAVAKLEATAESERTFGDEVTAETHDVVCDDCWGKILAWYEENDNPPRFNFAFPLL